MTRATERRGSLRRSSPLGRAFEISLLLKAADAVLEVIGGVLFAIVSPTAVGRVVSTLTQHELSEDPHDYVVTLLRGAVTHFGSSRVFAAVYLLSHGIGKIVLVVEIFRGRLWAYPGMIVLLLLFIAYQIYRLTHGFSMAMLALTVFDAVLVWLTWSEYDRQRSSRRAARAR